MRLWLLFVGACVVLLGIRMLREPEAARRIGRVFQLPEPPNKSAVTISEALGREADNVELGPAPGFGSVVKEVQHGRDTGAESTGFDLSSVHDNTYFRPEENTAWFGIFRWLKTVDPAELAVEPTDEVSYAQFIDQPNVYRGQLVTVRGTAEREELLDAPANDIGINRYHRLILRPKGGGNWPIVVYCLELPAQFPRGENPNAEVQVHGVFFKNWSYAWQNGIGLAPVVLAKTIEWQPAVRIKRPQVKVSVPRVIGVTAAAGVIAAFVGLFAWRHTRRPPDILAGHREVISPPGEN